MICIYEKTETSFTYNGLGTLEPTYCSYSPFVNDVWKLEMYLPYDPEGKYKLVANGRILKVTGIDCIQEQTSDYQLFYIETYRKEGNSIYVLAYPVGLNARFDTYANQVKAEYKTAAQAIALINAVKAITLNNQQIDKYTVSTDISATDLNSAVWNNTNIISMLTNDENGFIHRWGGEVCYDNYNIKVNQRLGRSSGASEVRYGKNIRGMSYEEDTSNVITRLYPVANGGEILNGINAYKIANTQYVDSTNVSDYPIPHIAYTNAPYNLVQMSDDGSANYAATILRYEQIRDAAADWLNDALLGENTGGVDGLLVDIELAWFVDNYALTLANDGTQGLAEYVTNKICSDSTNPILSNSVKAMIYEAVKAGFELVLKDTTTAVYIGATSKKMWDAPLSTHFYSYTWDSAGDYRVNKNGDADYAWVYASSKWQQLDDDGITTGTVDTATWKWYKVSGASYKRYGNKKKKRYLKSQWWNINGIWYWFGSNGKGDSGLALQNTCYEMFDNIDVSNKSIYELLSPICKSAESDLFDILYTQMTDYCTNMFSEEKISYPTPSITIDMVDLSKTVEYAGYENLLKIKLGDTVKCVNTKLNISTDLRVTGLTYDVLKGYNTSIQIGLTETSIISELDRPVNNDLIAKQGLVAGHGIRIVGNVISATGTNLTDVIVGGQSVVYGGKAVIDLDEIGGEGLQWFEETEDALFGVTDDRVEYLIDDPIYKGSGFESWAGEGSCWKIKYYPYNSDDIVSIFADDQGFYINNLTTPQKSYRGYHGAIFLARDPSLLTINYKLTYLCSIFGDELGEADSTMSGEPETDSRIEFTDVEGSACSRLANYYERWSSAEVNGETWYALYVYSRLETQSSDYSDLSKYLPQSAMPVNGYDTLADVIEALVPLSKTTEHQVFNGISREGDLAFFAGAEDEHGLNAPIKIFSDGTTEGLLKDVKSDNVSVVTDDVAHINTMVGATSQDNGVKGLVPAPQIAEKDKYLKGDGTWDTPSGGGGASALDDLTDVDITSPSNNDVLTYNSTSQKWENGSGGASDLEDLGDVNITTPTNGQVLKYDSATSKWINANESGGGGSFVGLSKTDYDALPLADKEDTTKLYFVQEGGGEPVLTPLDVSGGTVKKEGSMAVSATSSSVSFSWNGGTQIGGEYRFTALDVTNIDEISYQLTTTTCYGHNNSNVQEQTNARFQIKVCLFNNISFTNYAVDNLANAITYNNHKYTNTTYSANECKIDTSNITGVVYIVVDAHGWNATFGNWKTKSPSSSEIIRHIFWNNAEWAKLPVSNTITYGTTTPTSAGTEIDGDLYILLDGNNEKIGEYLFISNAWVQIE